MGTYVFGLDGTFSEYLPKNRYDHESAIQSQRKQTRSSSKTMALLAPTTPHLKHESTIRGRGKQPRYSSKSKSLLTRSNSYLESSSGQTSSTYGRQSRMESTYDSYYTPVNVAVVVPNQDSSRAPERILQAKKRALMLRKYLPRGRRVQNNFQGYRVRRDPFKLEIGRKPKTPNKILDWLTKGPSASLPSPKSNASKITSHSKRFSPLPPSHPCEEDSVIGKTFQKYKMPSTGRRSDWISEKTDPSSENKTLDNTSFTFTDISAGHPLSGETERKEKAMKRILNYYTEKPFHPLKSSREDREKLTEFIPSSHSISEEVEEVVEHVGRSTSNLGYYSDSSIFPPFRRSRALWVSATDFPSSNVQPPRRVTEKTFLPLNKHRRVRKFQTERKKRGIITLDSICEKKTLPAYFCSMSTYSDEDEEEDDDEDEGEDEDEDELEDSRRRQHDSEYQKKRHRGNKKECSKRERFAKNVLDDSSDSEDSDETEEIHSKARCSKNLREKSKPKEKVKKDCRGGKRSKTPDCEPNDRDDETKLRKGGGSKCCLTKFKPKEKVSCQKEDKTDKRNLVNKTCNGAGKEGKQVCKARLKPIKEENEDAVIPKERVTKGAREGRAGKGKCQNNGGRANIIEEEEEDEPVKDVTSDSSTTESDDSTSTETVILVDRSTQWTEEKMNLTKQTKNWEKEEVNKPKEEVGAQKLKKIVGQEARGQKEKKLFEEGAIKELKKKTIIEEEARGQKQKIFIKEDLDHRLKAIEFCTYEDVQEDSDDERIIIFRRTTKRLEGPKNLKIKRRKVSKEDQINYPYVIKKDVLARRKMNLRNSEGTNRNTTVYSVGTQTKPPKKLGHKSRNTLKPKLKSTRPLRQRSPLEDSMCEKILSETQQLKRFINKVPKHRTEFTQTHSLMDIVQFPPQITLDDAFTFPISANALEDDREDEEEHVTDQQEQRKRSRDSPSKTERTKRHSKKSSCPRPCCNPCSRPCCKPPGCTKPCCRPPPPPRHPCCKPCPSKPQHHPGPEHEKDCSHLPCGDNKRGQHRKIDKPPDEEPSHCKSMSEEKCCDPCEGVQLRLPLRLCKNQRVKIKVPRRMLKKSLNTTTMTCNHSKTDGHRPPCHDPKTEPPMPCHDPCSYPPPKPCRCPSPPKRRVVSRKLAFPCFKKEKYETIIIPSPEDGEKCVKKRLCGMSILRYIRTVQAKCKRVSTDGQDCECQQDVVLTCQYPTMRGRNPRRPRRQAKWESRSNCHSGRSKHHPGHKKHHPHHLDKCSTEHHGDHHKEKHHGAHEKHHEDHEKHHEDHEKHHEDHEEAEEESHIDNRRERSDESEQKGSYDRAIYHLKNYNLDQPRIPRVLLHRLSKATISRDWFQADFLKKYIKDYLNNYFARKVYEQAFLTKKKQNQLVEEYIRQKLKEYTENCRIPGDSPYEDDSPDERYEEESPDEYLSDSSRRTVSSRRSSSGRSGTLSSGSQSTLCER